MLAGLVIGMAAGYAYRSGEVFAIIMTTALLLLIGAIIIAEAYANRSPKEGDAAKPAAPTETDHTAQNLILIFLVTLVAAIIV